MKFEDLLGLIFFGCTVVAYLLLFSLGYRWRKIFEAKGIKYWTAPKEERIKHLTEISWKPRFFTLIYGLAYFANGYMKISFTLWAPLFLLQERGFNTLETALFLALAYVSWQWKMFLGLASDGLSIEFRGVRYRRLPWFIITGILSIIATLGYLFSDINTIPIWTVFFPITLAMTTAGAIFDMTADSLAVDLTPPDWHARVLGTVNSIGMSIGGIVASLLCPLLIAWSGYTLVFITGGICGMFSFFFLLVKEPQLEDERVLSKQAIAFTFTEKSVLVASLLTIGSAIGIQRIANPTGGMFSLIMNHVMGNVSPTMAGNISMIILLIGIPGSYIGGIWADRVGHKKAYTITCIIWALSGFLWMTLTVGSVLLFIILAIVSNFFERMNSISRLALMGDSTPLALSGTVFQMYMSLSWIGNIPSALIIGYLLPISIPTLFAILSILSLTPVIFVRYLKSYEAGKGSNI